MYGKTYFGNERTTFVIGPDGVVASVLRKVKPAEHDERVLAALREAAPPRRLRPGATRSGPAASDASTDVRRRRPGHRGLSRRSRR